MSIPGEEGFAHVGPEAALGVVVADTATKLPGPVRARVVVAASHGGRYPAWLVARAGARAAILNDAGIGKDEAGIAALAYGDAIGMAIATVSHMSCRIGDGHDMVTRGVVSGANRLAGAVGVGWGDPCLAAAEALCAAPLPAGTPTPVPEGRRVLSVPGASRVVVLIDSASLVAPEDCGQIVVTGSDGGLIGSANALALQVDAFAAFYNDADRGADDWGVMRLPALDERGIAAATVAATSARIGEAGSTYEEGVISATNATARALGVSPGNRCRDVVDMLCRR